MDLEHVGALTGSGRRRHRQTRHLPLALPGQAGWLAIFFIFNFFNNILILTRLPFYLHGISRLVAPSVLARQLASVRQSGWRDRRATLARLGPAPRGR